MFKKKFNKITEKIEETIESTKDTLDDISMPVSTTKIAITGLSRSGKTVFITSLINQLLHQKKITRITNTTSKYKAFKVGLKPPKTSVKRFDYYTLRDIIKIDSKWPDNTNDITSTILEFESKRRFKMLGSSKFRIELIDYPGEWILDIPMLGLSYEKWSDKVITWMKNINEDLATKYLKEIQKLTENSSGAELEQKLHQQYSDMIRYFKKNHYASLTPGRFLMPSDLAGDPMLLFAPIYKSDSSLHQAFEKRYKTYLKEIVKGIQLEHFKGFDRQIVLIDIVESLQNGSQCYTDMKDGLRSMLSLYDHRDKNFISQFFSSSVKNVTFVATKADLVASSQHNNYLDLLNEMVDDIRKELDISNIKTNTQVIAAIKCTQTVIKKHEGKTLSCIKGILAKTNEIDGLYPGEMPSTFPRPDQWDTGYYDYEEFLPPKKSYKENEPFDHIHMDRVIESIIGDLL